MGDVIDSPFKLRQVIENAAASARLRREKDPRFNVVAFFSVTDMLEALASGILRSRSPDPGYDPKGIIFQISDIMALFEHRVLEHMMREHGFANGQGEYRFLNCFHGTSLRALEVMRMILSTINKFALFGQGKGGYDIDAVFQNIGNHLVRLAAEQERWEEIARS